KTMHRRKIMKTDSKSADNSASNRYCTLELGVFLKIRYFLWKIPDNSKNKHRTKILSADLKSAETFT
ncbi:hypothetical protein, partial [Klebsiella pneumoniae]|uniref:hypothetical protein n=1 Tax=Klebsiella pneumoniae TaxID=573 RepID=UPI003EB864B0